MEKEDAMYPTNVSKKHLAFAAVILAAIGITYVTSTFRRAEIVAPEWKVRTTGSFTHEESFWDVLFFDTNHGLALSETRIQQSSDGGRNWHEIPNEKVRRYYSLVHLEEGLAWAVGSDENDQPIVLKVSKNPSDWKKVELEESNRLEFQGRFAAFSDACIGPSGKAWFLANSELVEPVVDGRAGGKTIWRKRQVQQPGIVEAVMNNGDLKVLSVFFSEEPLQSISCSDSGEVWAVGRGIVLYYNKSWKRIEIDRKYLFERVISRGNHLWLVGGDWSEDEKTKAGFPRPGILLRSRDYGQTWENKTPTSANMLNDMNFADGRTWLVGDGGIIYSSIDDGDSWSRSENSNANDLHRIFFLGFQHGWIVGDRATVLVNRN